MVSTWTAECTSRARRIHWSIWCWRRWVTGEARALLLVVERPIAILAVTSDRVWWRTDSNGSGSIDDRDVGCCGWNPETLVVSRNERLICPWCAKWWRGRNGKSTRHSSIGPRCLWVVCHANHITLVVNVDTMWSRVAAIIWSTPGKLAAVSALEVAVELRVARIGCEASIGPRVDRR